jgi:hypothetical protein
MIAVLPPRLADQAEGVALANVEADAVGVHRPTRRRNTAPFVSGNSLTRSRRPEPSRRAGARRIFVGDTTKGAGTRRRLSC